MKFLFPLAIITLVFCACKHKDNGSHLSPKVMKNLLLDIHLAENYSTMKKDSTYKQPGTKNLDSLAVYYKDIFAHYHITPEQFSENLTWYKKHPEDLDTIYAAILPVATAMQTSNNPAPAHATPPPPVKPPVPAGKK